MAGGPDGDNGVEATERGTAGADVEMGGSGSASIWVALPRALRGLRTLFGLAATTSSQSLMPCTT
jgi:hypothetical protein